MARQPIGEILLKADNISLSFGGVKALSNISFDVREHELAAIIGPNGAGKSSMLNVINGFYHPQQGQITFKGQTRSRMKVHQAAVQGIARTFQNIALFKGMSVLDNLMTGRNLKMHSTMLEQAVYWGAPGAKNWNTVGKLRRSSTFSTWSQCARHRSVACPMASRSGWNWAGHWRQNRPCCCSTSLWPV